MTDKTKVKEKLDEIHEAADDIESELDLPDEDGDEEEDGKIVKSRGDPIVTLRS